MRQDIAILLPKRNVFAQKAKESGAMEDCIFCKIVAKKIPAAVVFENQALTAFRDIHPQAPVHVVIIPKRHVETVMDLGPEDRSWWEDLVAAIQQIAKKEKVDQNGFRLVVNCRKDAGQEVAHLHLHLLGGRKMTWPPG
jgi:histidine triad (HIT) family protein